MILQVNAQPHKVSTVKARVLIGQKWDSESWEGDTWEDSDEDGTTEPPNSDETFLPVQAASPPLS